MRSTGAIVFGSLMNLLILSDLVRLWASRSSTKQLESAMITVLGLLLYQGLGAQLFAFAQYAKRAYISLVVLIPFLGFVAFILFRSAGQQWLIYPLLGSVYVAFTEPASEGMFGFFVTFFFKLTIFWGCFAFAVSAPFVPFGRLTPETLNAVFPTGSPFHAYVPEFAKIVFALVLIQLLEIAYLAFGMHRFGNASFLFSHLKPLGIGLAIVLVGMMAARLAFGLLGKREFFATICPTYDRPASDAHEPAAHLLFNAHALQSMDVPFGKKHVERFVAQWKKHPPGPDLCTRFRELSTRVFLPMHRSAVEAVESARQQAKTDDFRDTVRRFTESGRDIEGLRSTAQLPFGLGSLAGPMSTNQLLVLAILKTYDAETERFFGAFWNRLRGPT